MFVAVVPQTHLNLEVYKIPVIVRAVSSEGEWDDPGKHLSLDGVSKRLIGQVVVECVDPGRLAYAGAAQDEDVELFQRTCVF